MRIIILAAVSAMSMCLLFSGAVPAQSNDDKRGEPRMRDVRERPGDSVSLTDAQKAAVKSILSKYNASGLTTDDAKAIHRAFKDAGLQGGPGLNEAVTSEGFDPEKLRDLNPPPDRKGRVEEYPKVNERGRKGPDQGNGGPQQYSIDQAVSDQAQLHTIAFSGFAFITGDFGAATFIPPGKVCDFFGFQYMRDIDTAQKGHNPMFLDRVAGNVLHVLTNEQRKVFADFAREQATQLNELALKRLPLIKAFYRELTGDVPPGSQGLNRNSVMRYVSDIYTLDAKMSYRRAQIFGQIVSSFTPEQKAYFARMIYGDFNTWPDVDTEPYKLTRGTEKLINVAYMTFASELFSWYAGSLEADTYFCPERHGTYFGGFYIKDMPAMGKRDFDIKTSVTGDSGKEFLDILTQEQRLCITAIPDLQRNKLQEIVGVRRAIVTELRKFLSGDQADMKKTLALGRHYGELDGEMSYEYETAFVKVNRSLTEKQRKALIRLRNLDGYTSAPAYIYSTPIQGEIKQPDTDHFFFPVTNTADGAK
jgi:hypothetical protein